ncbi:aspartyl-phosphate phosphatase Spo0E family protein [Halobacillus halophilus]|nr:aspartyl-phosphate phosphatase Spo0E family protein [Halobacillus halophilus]
MSDKKHLENQIEETRVRMYAAYMNEAVFRDILIISQQLDYLLNKLENISK